MTDKENGGEVVQTGWMVQYADETGNWYDYGWTDDPQEERKMVRHLNRNGNKTRTVIRAETPGEMG